MNSAVLVGLATIMAYTDKGIPAATSAASASAPTTTATGKHVIAGLHPRPGELDAYYGLWSGGHTSDMRVMSMPSGRGIHHIPMFVSGALIGWSITDESKKVMDTKPDDTLRHTMGDIHHMHASYEDKNYDDRYAWINDKINSRLRRVRLGYFIYNKIAELPSVRGFHGIFPDRRSPFEPEINYTTHVFCGGKFAIPLLNTAGISDSSKYRSPFMCVDAETMEARWQVLIDDNYDLVATSYDGKLAATSQYNTEVDVHYEDMMSTERDAYLFFNVARIEVTVKAGKFETIGDSKVPVMDDAHAVNQNPKTALTAYVSIPKSPYDVNASPDQKYFICADKLSSTDTVIELSRALDWFDSKLAKIDDAIMAEVELGLGLLHTVFNGRDNAYTTLFPDSQIVKWNIDTTIKFYNGDKNAKYTIDRLDIHCQPDHLNASQSETMAADGKFLAVSCKFSKDRFLSVGPLHPGNKRFIDISGDRMMSLQNRPIRSEPHDFIVFKRELLHPKQVYSLDDFPLATKDPKQSGTMRNDRKVTTRLTSQVPACSLREFKLKKSDEVTLILTNLNEVKDLTHGFAIPKYNIGFIVNPQETASVTFIADRPSVFWCYCTHFCHALYLEVYSHMIVEA